MESDDEFDWLPVIITLAVLGALIVIGLVIWCCCCLFRGSGSSAPVKTRPEFQPPPAFVPAPMITTAAPQPFILVDQPPSQTVLAVPKSNGPIVEEVSVSSPPPEPSLISGMVNRGVAPAPPRVQAGTVPSVLALPPPRSRPTSIMRNNTSKSHQEPIVPKKEPLYYSESSRRPPSARYSGALGLPPIDASVRGSRAFPSGDGRGSIRAEVFPDIDVDEYLARS